MKVKKLLWILVTILITTSMLLGACVPAEPEATEEAAVEEEEMAEEEEEMAEEEEEMAEEEEEAGLGVVTIGSNAEYPPFEFVDEEGNMTGFDIELMKAIAEEAGFEYEFVNTRWDGIFVALASGEFDAVISAATITEERSEMVNFSDPYFNAGQRLAVRADETEIMGPDDLAGKKVGVQLGTTGDIWLTDNTEAEVVRYDENTLAFQALANGDVDAAMADGPTAVDIVKANPEMDLKVLEDVYTEEQYGIAVNPERDDVLAAINEGLAAVRESGKYDEIYDKYFSVEIEEEAAEEEAAPEGEELVVGLMTDKSGALAIYGPSQTNGFYLGLEYATDGTMEVAGRPIRVIEKDNGSDPEVGVSQARELIEAEGADILVGNISSGVALAVSPVAEENDVVFIAEPAAAPQITGANFSPNTFRTSRTSYQDALVMGTGLLEMGDTFVQIAPDYAFGIGSACSFYPVVKEGGGEFVLNDTAEECGTIFAPIDTTDFTPYINQILDSGADVVIVTWAGAGFAPLFQQMSQLGVFDEMVVGTGVGDNQTLAAGYADAVGSVGVQVYHYTLPDNEINDWLVQAHIDEYGTPPDLWAAGGMMAAIMMVEGLEATEGDSSADMLIEVFEDDFQFEGPKGTVSIRPYDHVALQNLYFVRVDNVTDPDLKFVELITDFAPEETAPPCQLPEELADRCP